MIIGNPPYIRQEELSDIKDYLKANYDVYTLGGDLFFYFYELGFKLLRRDGNFSFINNTFDKTTAGKALREFATKNFHFKRYIDFTDVSVFEEATTYPIVLVAEKSQNKSMFKFFKFTKESFDRKELLYDETVYTDVSQDGLSLEGWNFIDQSEQQLLDKIGRHKRVRELYGKCFRGIVTGFNDAFIISEKISKELIDQDENSSEIIKPIREGKDLKKWSIKKPVNKFIIFTRRNVNISDYPVIEKYLLPKKDQLTPKSNPSQKVGRKAGQYKWYEIQDVVNYYREFDHSKIIFPNLQNSNKFAFDETGVYLNAPSVFLPTSDKALLAILNSKVVWHFLKSICVVRSGGYIEVKPQYFEQIPIPELDKKVRGQLSALAEKAIHAPKQNQEMLVLEIEHEIDQLVYELYGLTDEEIAIVEEAQ